MKSNYKPRLVEFVHFHTKEKIWIDTRQGMHGYYPGDVLIDGNIVLGVAKSYDEKKSLAVTFASTDNFHFLTLLRLGRFKRHAQHLIDSGEMVQYEDVNK